ncbi:MAG: alpha/beta hydrolase [Pseudomonadota bacterium]|nr:alpha/beta hydrolase [Pseudomonadota bacterium]
MATIHPDMQVLMDARAAAGEKGYEAAGARRFWTAYTGALSQPCPPDMAVHDTVVPTPDYQVPVRIYRPAGDDGARPCILYLHGGGFMLGDLDSSDSIAWGFAQNTGAVVVSVDYRLTPEHPYPAAFNDSYGTLCHVAANVDDYGIDPARIALAGDSAGGNLSAATCLAARDRGGPKIAAQALIYPGTGLDKSSPSYVEHADSPGLTTEGTKKYYDLYLPDDCDTDDPYARPVMATDHSGLPPAWVHSAEIDPIRDDGRVYAGKLAGAGNWVTYREARGMIHGFMRARFTGDAARAEFDAICGFLSLHLDG